MAKPDLQYWANYPILDLLPTLNGKMGDYYEFCNRHGFMDRWRRSYLTYYGRSESGTDTTRLSQTGDNGEYYILKVNHFRSLLQNLLVLITQQPPAIQPKATNTDSKSMSQTVLAKSVLDYYMRDQNMEKYLNNAAEMSLIGAEGFLLQTWDANAGEEAGINPDTGRPFYDGDVKHAVFHPVDMIRECNTESTDTSPWRLVRTFKNKYDLAAKYPEQAEDIINITRSPDYMSQYHYLSFESSKGDDIPTYLFLHKETDACPNGRQVEYLTNEIWLTDTAMPYKNMPVYEMSPAKWHGTPFGYTVAYDMMGIQKNIDALQSIVATNQMNYGVQNIIVERGSNISIVSLAQGLNAIEVNAGHAPPAPLNLVQTPREIFEQINSLVKEMETLSGINSTARGNPEESLKSGTALALVAAQAIQFNSGLQKSYNNLIQDAATGLIEILQMFANTPRLAAIAGKSNRSRVREFKGEDLSNISRVVVETVNPISKTAAGRLQMAQDLLQIPNMIRTPQHYFEVIETGTLEPMVEHEISQMIYIRSENEELSEGNTVQAVLTDTHLLHIHEHTTVLDSIEARQNQQVVKNVTDHIQEHFGLLRNTDPALLQALGQQPIPPPQPPGMPGPGGPPAGAPHAGPPGPPAPMMHPPGPGGIHHGIPANVHAGPPVGQAATEHLQKPKLPTLPHGAPPQLEANYDQLKGNVGAM